MNVCDGQPLSACLEALVNDHNPGNNQDGAEAIRAIGTNAIPFLLQMLREHDSEVKTLFFKWMAKQDVIQLDHVPANDRHYEAVAAFKVLGSKASNAVPELLKIYTRNKHEDVLVSVSDCLGYIGPAASPAIPALLRCANGSTEETSRYAAISALGEIGAQPEFVVPKLIPILSDADSFARCQSAVALGNFGSQAWTAIPLIIENLDREHDPWWRNKYFMALHEIDWDAAAEWERTNALHTTSSLKTALSN